MCIIHCRKYYLHDCNRDSHVHKSITNIIAIEPRNLKKCNRRWHLHNCYRKCQLHSSNRNCYLQNYAENIVEIFNRETWTLKFRKTLKHWVVVQRDQSYLMGRRCLFALVGDPSSDGVTIKMPYGVNILHRPASHPIFSYWVS